MKGNKLTYSALLFVHVGLGLLFFIIPFLSKVFSLLILAMGAMVIIKNKNRNNEALYAAAYIVGMEVLMRMTGGMFFNEFGKYTVMVFMFLGMFYTGFSRNSIVYWLFILLFIPGIIIATTSLSVEADVRKAIAFNISGPACLAISAIYCYRRRISFDELNLVVIALALPIVSLLTFLFLYTPSVKDVVFGTSSNFETSGGFGPNQVATILGLGIFLFFALLLLNSKSKKMMLIHCVLACMVAFRGIVTFSRGGVITGVVMLVLLLLVLFWNGNDKTRGRLGFITLFTILLSLGIWLYTSNQTGGLIDKRYANQDAIGREKKDRLGGREEIAKTELQMFWDHPLLGIGVGKNKEYRKETTGIQAASHNEITRLLAEHGLLGIVAFLILFLTPLILSIDNRQHLYLYSFFIFWLLTINHAAMRMAAPAFIYALSLLKVQSFEKPAIHRE